jgi:hypothetical protein
MKALLTSSLLICAVFIYSFRPDSTNEVEVETIKELIISGYVHGAFNELNPEAMKEAFHPDFAIFSAKGEELSRYEIEDWIASVTKRKGDPEFDPSNNVWEYKFGYVDVTGNSAALKLEYLREGKLVYTDYISLLKYDSGWKIVAKVYHYHGEKN